MADAPAASSCPLAQAASLSEAVHSEGCPVCFLLRRDEFEEVCRCVGGGLAEEANRRRLEAAGGFCNHHSWLLREIHSPVSGSKMNAHLVADLLARLKTALDGQQAVADWLSHAVERCPLCEHLAQCETAHLRGLVDWLASPGAWKEYEKSTGLCLPHLHRCALLPAGQSLIRQLVQAQIAQLERLEREMRACAAKLESGQRSQVSAGEWAAWRRTAEKLAGWRGLA